MPELYWFGRNARDLPFGSLPACYVIKPNLGFSQRGVYVMCEGTELLTGNRLTDGELRERLRGSRLRRPSSPLLVEEFVGAQPGTHEPPLEYKCHTFGGAVGAVQVIQRRNAEDYSTRFYTPNWDVIEDKMNAIPPQAAPISAPACLGQILAAAKRLGTAIGTYMRIDFYARGADAVFGELSSVPGYGRGWTRFADEYFGSLWEETCGEAI